MTKMKKIVELVTMKKMMVMGMIQKEHEIMVVSG